MGLASVTVLLKNLLEEFLPLVPMTPGCVNSDVLERLVAGDTSMVWTDQRLPGLFGS